MGAGRYKHVIEIQRPSLDVDGAGTPDQFWSKVVTLRAARIEQTSTEILRNSGDIQESTIIFETPWQAGIAGTDRILFDGEAYDIRRVVTIGRNRRLEITCRRSEP